MYFDGVKQGGEETCALHKYKRILRICQLQTDDAQDVAGSLWKVCISEIANYFAASARTRTRDFENSWGSAACDTSIPSTSQQATKTVCANSRSEYSPYISEAAQRDRDDHAKDSYLR
ncbi:hypothetical protein GQ600_23172 [Phytophthora cactorum]|nr:hypothetical protein GQ600_23172 [Phytophthora cactorum]